MDVSDGGVVVDGFGECGVDDAEFFCDGCGVREEFGDVYAFVVVVVFGEFVFGGADRK